ncbi:hypothetical protein [Bacillus sp. m3-13]
MDGRIQQKTLNTLGLNEAWLKRRVVKKGHHQY